MSSVAAQILEQFNSAFTAFLNPLTPQAERNALDQAFVDFEKQPDSWRICLEMMKMTENPHIHLIIQDTFIYVMKYRWNQLSLEDRTQIRESEISFYVNRFSSFPINIMHLTAKSIAWISVMEGGQCIQQVLDFIAGGLQNTSNCQSQLILLLVLLEEVYDSHGAIPLLTEKKTDIQAFISESVSGIVASVSQILQHCNDNDETILSSALQILLILIPHNDISTILDPSLIESLFKLTFEYNSSFSLEAIKCITELLMKRLIPFSYREIYNIIIATISNLIAGLTQQIDSVSSTYLKRLHILLYQLFTNYTPVLLSSNSSTFSLLLSNLVLYTQCQYDFRCYFQLLLIWNELFNILSQLNWDASSSIESLSSLFQSTFQLILESNHHSILISCSHTTEISDEEGDIPYEEEELLQNTVDDITGDYEDVPIDGLHSHTEYDCLINQTILLISKLLDFSPVYQATISQFYSYCYPTLQNALNLLNQSEWNIELQDSSTLLRIITNINFSDHNIDILLLLNNLIHECSVNNIYIKGTEMTNFYINTLLCFKQYIFLLNNRLDKTDIETIITSLYSTITSSVTVPPNLLLLTISNVLIYVASNCSIQNIFNLPFFSPLISNFFRETAQCQFVIQKQLLLFIIYLLLHNLHGVELQQALYTLIQPLCHNILTPTSPGSAGNRRSFTFRTGGVTGPSVVMNSIYIRSIYLLTAVLKVSYTANKIVRDVIYPELPPILSAVIQNLCNCFDHPDSSHHYENCRIMWNFVLYSTSVLRGHKETHSTFLPLIGTLFNYLPSLLSHITNTVKSIIYELHTLKMIRLINLLVMERSLPSEWLQNIIGLLVQIGPNCITSPSSEVTQIYLETCKMLISVHILALSKSEEIIQYIIHLSQLFYQLLANDTTPQEQLSQILSIYRNTDMLAFYKTNAFKNEMQQGLSIILLQRLLSDSHSTLASEMISALYTMNVSDFSLFYKTILPIFISSIDSISKEDKEKIVWGIKEVNDMPSFQTMILRLLQDLRIYSNCLLSVCFMKDFEILYIFLTFDLSF